MIATIIQPPYLPWLGFFDRVLKCDVLVLLDNVPMDRNSRTKFLNRNKVRNKEGWIWLTVPLAKGPRDQPILELRIRNDESWAEDHWRTIESCYKRARCFVEYATSLEATYRQVWLHLVDLNRVLLDILLRGFGMSPRIELASQLGTHQRGTPLLVEICHKVGASTYISGPFGRDYIDRGQFQSAGIELLFHDYVHPRYEQSFAGFEPHMSALDLLLNHGAEGRKLFETTANSLVTK
jgi:hypothetical protein